MAAAWPERAGDPFADQMNAIKKYVASRTLTQDDLTWNNTTLLSPDDAVGRHRRAARPGRRRLVDLGQRQPRADAARRGLVDELNLMIEPILLGGGKRIFPDDGAARPMQLVKCVTAGTGVQVCTYRPTS